MFFTPHKLREREKGRSISKSNNNKIIRIRLMTYQNGRTTEVKETKANANIIYIYIIILNQLIGKLKG